MNINHYSDEITKVVATKINNPWKGTLLEDYYNLNPAAKGSTGETIVKEILISEGYEIKNRKDAGHDFIMNGVPTEVKFALTTYRNCDYECIFNHIGLGKSWEQIILCCVNGDMDFRMVMFDKSNFPMELSDRQQGGKGGNNDDFMISGKKTHSILFHKDAKVLI